MRSIGLDIHRDFGEVAIGERGEIRSAGRIEMTAEALELFAASLGRDDRVALEVSGNAWEVARIIGPHVARVVVVSPADTGIRSARAKTDRLDARALAKLLAAGSLDSVWVPDADTQAMRRRLQRRSRLVRVRTKAKNEIHAALMRRLIAKPAVSDLFGVKGRRWLVTPAAGSRARDRRRLPAPARLLRDRDRADRAGDRDRGAEPTEIRRLMTVPGVNVITAATFMAAIGDIGRFGDRKSWSAIWGSIRRCASRGRARRRGPDLKAGLGLGSLRARRGKLERGPAPGPIHAFYQRIRPRRGTRRRSSPPRASSPACSGACSPGRRTTPMRSPR